MITIIDYGMGNLGSIKNMLKKIGVDSEITNNIEVIDRAKKIILPGVGSFDRAMENLKSLNLIDILNKKALFDKVPVLGICLGMHLLAKDSEEGNLPGLGWINANVLKFISSSLKIPHMGWNIAEIKKKNSLFENMYSEPRCYFVNSYYFRCNDLKDIITNTEYGIDFTSSVCNDNIMGVQFHPEKSHKFGMKLLENFAKI
jgi:glutamine amidotransferase